MLYFLSGGHKKATKPSVKFLCFFMFDFTVSVVYGLLWAVLSQPVGWNQHRQNEVFCVNWDLKL